MKSVFNKFSDFEKQFDQELTSQLEVEEEVFQCEIKNASFFEICNMWTRTRSKSEKEMAETQQALGHDKHLSQKDGYQILPDCTNKIGIFRTYITY